MNKETIIEQIKEWLEIEKDEFNKIRYGEINFVIQDGIVLRRKNIETKNLDEIKIGLTD